MGAVVTTGEMQSSWLLLCLCTIPTTTAKCTPDEYFGLIQCIGDEIEKHWKELNVHPNKKIEAEQILMQSCFKEGHCADKLDFSKDFVELLPESIRPLAKAIRDFWDSMSYLMKKCVLSSARDSLLADVQTCVQKEGQRDFVFPKSFPDFPMPDKVQYTNEKKEHQLLKRINDKINGFLSTKDCEKPRVVKNCFDNRTNTLVAGCFKSQLCKDESCKRSVPDICEAVERCIPQLTSNLVKQMGSIDSLPESEQNKYLGIMDKCEKEATRDNPDYKYSRVKAAKIMNAMERWKKTSSGDKQADSFKLFLEQMVNSYFDVTSVCRQSC